ncbi:MAG: winged helix-turn-helix domain-containing protein [Gemmatimonadales bacterium]|nr:winged helix-turn-helix domain-containing protein [Gemmatimonadales bacterium]
MVYQSAALDATFSALADPTRREILARLGRGDRTISELASRFDISLPAVSKHVRVLERAGLARIEREGRARVARITPGPMKGALAWIARYRRIWESELDQLARYLEETDPSTGTETHTPTPDVPWPQEPEPKRRSPRSRSAASSRRRGSASTPRGRRPKTGREGAQGERHLP